MTVDFLLRSLGVVGAPLVTLLVFALQDGRRRTRLAKEAKTSAELISLAPPNSRIYDDLVKHYELAVEAYLYAHRPWRWQWSCLVDALILGVLGLWTASVGWVILASKGAPTWMWWVPNEADRPPASWLGWLFLIVAVPLLIWAVRGVLQFLRGGRRTARSERLPPGR